MASDSSEDEPASRGAAQFATTHWSVVLEAGHGSSVAAQTALEELCQAYWYPLYVYVRRRGYGVEDAQDLTQEFFALLLRKGHFALPNPARGKFRSFLLRALQHFLVNNWNRSHTVTNLREECRASGRVERFEALKDSLWGEKTNVSYADLGQRWGTTEGAVKGAAHRLRHRYRELLEMEIAHTVATHEEVEQELRDLITAVSG